MIYEKWTLPPRDDLKIFQNFVNTFHAYRNPTRAGFAEYKEFYLNPKRRPADEEAASCETASRNLDLFATVS